MPSWTGPYDPDQTDIERLAFLKDTAQHFAEPWKSAFLWVPDGTPFPCSNLTYWETCPWDNQRGVVTLAGDAAHAMPPRELSCMKLTDSPLTLRSDRGQGLNHSIQDAVNLVAAIRAVDSDENSLSTAIDKYDAEVLKRGSDEVRTSVKSAILTHDFAKLTDAPVMKQGYVKTDLA